MYESILLLLPTPTYITHTITILLHNYYIIFNTPNPPYIYDTPYTILVIAITCKYQTLTQKKTLPSIPHLPPPPPISQESRGGRVAGEGA